MSASQRLVTTTVMRAATAAATGEENDLVANASATVPLMNDDCRLAQVRQGQ